MEEFQRSAGRTLSREDAHLGCRCFFPAGKPRQAVSDGLLRFPVDLFLRGLAQGRLWKICKAICGRRNAALGPAVGTGCCRIASTSRRETRWRFSPPPLVKPFQEKNPQLRRRHRDR